ncbi:MAG: hypothetical protein KAJ18_02780 [Candidatus Omnitrophica bacterium]|nr:hypothetical protein [Candidatus Omnitrophota bacterium]
MNIFKKQLLVFGYGLAAILTFLAWRIWAKHGGVVVPACLVSVAVVLAGLAALRWEALIPFYKKWMKVVHFIGTIITTVLLSVLFYSIFGVVGIILRLLRKDLLDRKLEPDCASYWHKRPKEAFNKQHYIRQF